MLALLAGAIAGTHRAALCEIQRRIMSGTLPARMPDAVGGCAGADRTGVVTIGGRSTAEDSPERPVRAASP